MRTDHTFFAALTRGRWCLVLVGALSLVTLRCKDRSAPAPGVAQSQPTKAPATVFTYCVVANELGARYSKPTPTLADAKQWMKAPAHARVVEATFRHILIKVGETAAADEQATARKTAEAALARVMRGEDFAKVATAMSEDYGSKSTGGAYPAIRVREFVEPIRAVYEALKPGELSKVLVRTPFGWHVVKKDAATNSEILAAYRSFVGDEAAQKVANEIATRLGSATERSGDLLGVAKGAVRAILGDAAAADEDLAKQVTLTSDSVSPENATKPPCRDLLATPHGAVRIIPYERVGYAVVVAELETDEMRRSRTSTKHDGGEVATDVSFGICRGGHASPTFGSTISKPPR